MIKESWGCSDTPYYFVNEDLNNFLTALINTYNKIQIFIQDLDTNKDTSTFFLKNP